MTRDIFHGWVTRLEVKFSKQKKKVLNLLDNFSVHYLPIFKLNFIKAMFLPANTTSLSQPMDQGIIANLKYFYTKKLLNRYWLDVKAKNSSKEINSYKALSI